MGKVGIPICAIVDEDGVDWPRNPDNLSEVVIPSACNQFDTAPVGTYADAGLHMLAIREDDPRECVQLPALHGVETDSANVTIASDGGVSADVKIDPAGSLPITVSPAGIKFDCCPSVLLAGDNGVTQSLDPGDTLRVVGGQSMDTTVLSQDTVRIDLAISADPDNELEFGSDGNVKFVEDLTVLQRTGPLALSYLDEDGVLTNIDFCPDVAACETTTNISYNPLTNIISYVNEDGVTQNLDLSALAIDINVASMVYDPVSGEIVLTETDGTPHVIDIGPTVVPPETVFGAVSGDNSVAIIAGGANGHAPDLRVNVSSDPKNLIEKRANGLYAGLQDKISRRTFVQFPSVVQPANTMSAGQVLFSTTMTLNNDLPCPALMDVWFGYSQYTDIPPNFFNSGWASEISAVINGTEYTDGVGGGYNGAFNFQPTGYFNDHDSGELGFHFVVPCNPGVNTAVVTITCLQVQSNYAGLTAIEGLHGGMTAIIR